MDKTLIEDLVLAFIATGAERLMARSGANGAVTCWPPHSSTGWRKGDES
jgi:hypothetical protein